MISRTNSKFPARIADCRGESPRIPVNCLFIVFFNVSLRLQWSSNSSSLHISTRCTQVTTIDYLSPSIHQPILRRQFKIVQNGVSTQGPLDSKTHSQHFRVHSSDSLCI
ncbi:hypothetical protein V8G54_020084 [Vigna mungo]|uniref:Uncharacterized protein n=1 Tax=Vigna mungo TaxID=3915 RepID=A0AAQ3RVK8_VIGMU